MGKTDELSRVNEIIKKNGKREKKLETAKKKITKSTKRENHIGYSILVKNSRSQNKKREKK